VSLEFGLYIAMRESNNKDGFSEETRLVSVFFNDDGDGNLAKITILDMKSVKYCVPFHNIEWV
jgi:hypothetical protein